MQFTVDAGSTLGLGHQRWMMNEINPLIWPSPDGIGSMPLDTYETTVQIISPGKALRTPLHKDETSMSCAPGVPVI